MTATVGLREVVTAFIETIWNTREYARLDEFLHPNFVDHSLPPGLPTSKVGLQKWIEGTGAAFEHHTTIEAMVCEGDQAALKIRMALRHVGRWHDIEPLGAEIETVGYRFFRVVDGKIAEHWGLLDGTGIELQLKEAAACSLGCKVQV